MASVMCSMALLRLGTNISAEALHWALDTVMSRAFTSEEAGGWPCCNLAVRCCMDRCPDGWSACRFWHNLTRADCKHAGPGQTALFKCVGAAAALFALSAMLGENGKLVCYCIMAGIIMQVSSASCIIMQASNASCHMAIG
jgi:hypothetical protein